MANRVRHVYHRLRLIRQIKEAPCLFEDGVNQAERDAVVGDIEEAFVETGIAQHRRDVLPVLQLGRGQALDWNNGQRLSRHASRFERKCHC
jgi:hypothetical protein